MADIAENALFTDPVAAISQGKRHLLVRDYGMAVTALAQACELLAQKHGDTSDELGEPFLLYGRALLALAREETGVLGGAVPGSDEVEAEGEGEDDEDAVEEKEEENEDEEEEHPVKKSNGAATDAEKEALANNEANTKADSSAKPESDAKEAKVEAPASAEGKESSTAEQKEETAVEKKESSTPEEKAIESGTTSSEESKIEESKENIEPAVASASTSSGETATRVKENGDASGEEEEDGEDVAKEEEEEDINNLQLAWEILESGKLILLKRGPPGWKHLAEAHRLLGEVAMESGNQQGALTDLQACLDLLAKIEPCDPRAMAETYYQLGLAYSLANEFDSSIEQFKEATLLLQSHIQHLEETKDSHKNDDPFYTVEGEIKELKELLPEIQEKIADMKDFKEEACKAMVEGIKSKVAAGCLNGAGPSGDGASSSGAEPSSTNQAKPASDISHLVRKKRKAEEPEKPEVGTPSKKPTP